MHRTTPESYLNLHDSDCARIFKIQNLNVFDWRAVASAHPYSDNHLICEIKSIGQWFAKYLHISLYIYMCLHIKATLVTQIEVSFKSWVCHSTHGLATSVFLHPGRNNWHWNPCEIALDATFQLSKWSRACHSLQSVFCLQMPSRLHWGPQARCSTWIP